MKTLISLGRYGDILSLLPAVQAGLLGKVNWVVGKDFCDVLTGQENVNPVPWLGSVEDVNGAIAKVIETGIDSRDIIVAQVNQNPVSMPRNLTHNFQHEAWARCGIVDALDKLIALPLSLHRWPSLEIGYVQRTPVHGGRVLLVNMSSISALYPASDARELIKFLESLPGIKVVDISLERVTYLSVLLGLFDHVKDRGGALLTVDTSLLHLAYAVGIPTIALVNDDKWLAPITRRHWLARIPYARSMTKEGRSFIRERLEVYAKQQP